MPAGHWLGKSDEVCMADVTIKEGHKCLRDGRTSCCVRVVARGAPACEITPASGGTSDPERRIILEPLSWVRVSFIQPASFVSIPPPFPFLLRSTPHSLATLPSSNKRDAQ